MTYVGITYGIQGITDASPEQRLAAAVVKSGIDDNDIDWFKSPDCEPWIALIVDSSHAIDGVRQRAIAAIRAKRNGRAA